MRHRRNKLVVLLVLMGFGISCKAETVQHNSGSDTTSNTYVNPVFEPVLADPSVIRDAKTGFFYAFGTADNWGDGRGLRLVPMLKSKNLSSWSYVKNALTTKPNWKKDGGIWAPDVNLVNGKYYMYYAFSTWGDPNPGIGLAIADSLNGDFVDHGKVFLSAEVNVPNSIDPCFFEEGDRKYLFWGSFSDLPTQGTYTIELAKDGKSVANINKKVKIAAGDWEAVMIHKRGQYYYFFGSKGSCCEGISSTYHVLVGRSENLLGPYVDKEGRPITERDRGTLLIKGNDKFVGTGHNARIITDDEGSDWFLYHGFRADKGNLSNGTDRRILLLDKLTWKDGWPEINSKGASFGEQKAPVFN